MLDLLRHLAATAAAPRSAAAPGGALQLLRPLQPRDGRWQALWQPAVLLAASAAMLTLCCMALFSAGLLVLAGALIVALLQQVFGVELSLAGVA